ncbi:hypothetical protein BGX27_000639 [Mortierella sp. AM989]|nr:hypothetical protein BGX27_000639 [Mortierella sp. AM989]
MRGLSVPSQGDMETTIDRRAKARVIFSKMNDPTYPLSLDDACCKLDEYLEASRSEALEVIEHLSDMAKSAIEQPPPDARNETLVDWRTFVVKLAQLS